MTKTGKTKTNAVGNLKFKNRKTFEEVEGRKGIHWVEKGAKKRLDPLRRHYSGWKCKECGEQNSNHELVCRSCGKKNRREFR